MQLKNNRLIILLVAALCTGQPLVYGQGIADTIRQQDARRILGILAADSMKGRGNGRAELLKAAIFIGDEMKRCGLKPMTGHSNFYLPFRPFGGARNLVTKEPVTLEEVKGTPFTQVQYNVVGMLKGTTRPNEIVLITSHYDHEGVYEGEGRDSILNGANDNASGVTAMLMLADYFARKGGNERSILFCAFSGEELGLNGSYDFAQQIKADSIVAAVNIEMIGVRQYSRKTVFITGDKYSSLPRILQKGLRRAGIRSMQEPDLSKKLFMRSDNFPFAEKGIPAHTIMASDDDEHCYHQPCDEIKRIDFSNMTSIIRGIATAILPIIAGEVSPTRPDPNDYKAEKTSNYRIPKW